MIANSNPSVTAGMIRAEVELWRGEDGIPAEFLVLVEPRGNPLIMLLQVAKLHTARPWMGADVTIGNVPDGCDNYVAFTYTGSADSFWDGLMRVTEQVIMDAEDVQDDRFPGQRAFARMLREYGLPPLEVLPDIKVGNDGVVYGESAWEELM